MTAFPELSSLRIGCVRYLNSRPLIHAFPGPVLFEHPSVLARLLASGDLDLALVPIFDILQHPGYRVVDQVAIASRGPVYSVFFAFTGELKAVRKIQTDPASMTSVNLMQVLLREFHGIIPQAGPDASGEAQLLIGSQAIEFRQTHGAAYQYLDLGEEWLRLTGLPFVFAAWALRPGVAPEAADAIRRVTAASHKALEEIIAGEPDPVFARDYLTNKIRYVLGSEEKQAIALFSRLLEKHALGAPASALEYV